MSVLNRARRSRPMASAAGSPKPDPSSLSVNPTDAPRAAVPGTRTSVAWLGICAAAVSGVVLIVFLLQNTRTVEVNFLWMEGSLPLAVALLIAGVGAGLVAMVVGTARMNQLRHLFRQRRQ